MPTVLAATSTTRSAAGLTGTVVTMSSLLAGVVSIRSPSADEVSEIEPVTLALTTIVIVADWPAGIVPRAAVMTPPVSLSVIVEESASVAMPLTKLLFRSRAPV